MAPRTRPDPGPHLQRSALIATLKQALRLRGITYAMLAESLGVAEVTVKRMFSRGNLTLDRLLEVCGALDIDLFELARLARAGASQPRQLTLEQEQALAANEPLMLLFHLLLAGWSLADIRKAYHFEAARLEPLLLKLEDLGLIRRSAKASVQLRVARNLVWRQHGPVLRRYAKAAMQEFLNAPFEAEPELLLLQTRELGAASVAILKRKLERLGQEFLELAELDASSSNADGRRNVGMVLAIRPWVFSIARSRKRSGQETSDPPAPFSVR